MLYLSNVYLTLQVVIVTSFNSLYLKSAMNTLHTNALYELHSNITAHFTATTQN